jgi:predicted ATPase
MEGSEKLRTSQASFIFSEYEDQLVPALQVFWKSLKQDLVSQYSSTELGQEKFYHLPTGVNFSARAVEDEAFSIVSNGVRKLNDTLRKVVYLGPLRLEPRNVYDRTVSQISPQLPLGLKGELLARRIYENKIGLYPMPPKEGRPDNVKTHFKSALNEWLIYLGLAEDKGVEVTPEASYGYKLLVDGRGLPAMGTGVSQVLPVIALCLMIQEGGLGLLEEPELHLNPAIQQKLGDFFLAVSKSGRQLLIETHSEYLVTRLRLRVAENSEVRDQFNFIFTEWDNENGTSYSSVRADSDGLIHDWPKGFFDQVGADVRALLKIAAAKQI